MYHLFSSRFLVVKYHLMMDFCNTLKNQYISNMIFFNTREGYGAEGYGPWCSLLGTGLFQEPICAYLT